MDGTFTGTLLLIAIIFNVVHSNEKDNFMEISKKKDYRISPNTTANHPEPATIVQHGNNLFIKPKFIIGSPFTSYKQENKPEGCCEKVHTTSMLPGEETSMDIERFPASQIPPVFIPPILPSVIRNNVFIPPEFPIQSQTPTAPYPCFPSRGSMPDEELVVPLSCPPINLSPDVFLPPRIPIIVNKLIPPVVIPKPPELPPIILPKLPIEVIIQNPIFIKSRIPFPNQPVIVPHLRVCPPMVKCIVPERESLSIGDIFKVICDKFKNLLNSPSRIDLTNLVPQDEIVLTSDLPSAFPTICAQSIIAERLVPNIVRTNNDDVKVLMSPIFPSQFTSSGFYRKYKKG